MLKQKIQQESTEALKSGDQFLLGTLRMLLASIQNKEKEKRFKISKEHSEYGEDKLTKDSELIDDEVVSVISSEIKKRNDAIALYKQGNRPELAEREQKEIVVLKKYLPAQLSEEEIKKLAVESIAATGAKETKDMGKVMADLSSKIKGKADGGTVSKIVKELLGSNK
jgi:uncharacterized protein YqeY